MRNCISLFNIICPFCISFRSISTNPRVVQKSLCFLTSYAIHRHFVSLYFKKFISFFRRIFYKICSNLFSQSWSLTLTPVVFLKSFEFDFWFGAQHSQVSALLTLHCTLICHLLNLDALLGWLWTIECYQMSPPTASLYRKKTFFEFWK